MREYSKKPQNQSRTLDSNPRVSKQAPIADILQAYKNGTLGRQSIQRENVEDEELLQTKTSGQAPASVILQRYKDSIHQYASEEEDDLLQGKFETAQCEEIDEEELLQGKFDSTSITEQEPLRREEKSNNTGLPDNLKKGIESLSGYSMDDIKVHYNSSKPAQLQALAYTQGANIHIVPGQEQHLAHEAWHVVQQKQGRVQPTMQLQGIDVNDNEELEREAEIMGGMALNLQPKQAKELKNTVPRALTSQLFGGDIGRAKVLPRFGGVNPETNKLYTVRELLIIKDKKGGRPGQKAEVKRDTNHNNIDKVKFENDLALMILQCPNSYIEQPIVFLTKEINKYIDKKIKQGLIENREEDLNKFLSKEMKGKYTTIFGRLTAELNEQYTAYLDNLIINGGDLYSQLQMQAAFISEIYSKDFEMCLTDDVRFMSLVRSFENPKLYKDKGTFVSPGITHTAIPFDEAHDDARVRPQSIDSVYGKDGRDRHVPQSDQYYGITARELTEAPKGKGDAKFAALDPLSPSPAPFQRGMDYWTANEESAFIQDARLNLDMPVTGTGASGTTAELLTCAKIFGLPDGMPKKTYVIALLGYFIISGAHSFHEIMSIANNAGIPYTPGDYFNTLNNLSAGTEFEQPFNALMSYPKHQAFIKPTVAETLIPTPLRNEIFDEESSTGWIKPINDFFTSAFGFPCEEITVLGGGRSAAPVYKVKLSGTYYVFKIFPDIREAETEIKMLLLLREKGISSVMPKLTKDGNTVFPVGGKTSRKAGILMDLATGHSVDEIIEKQGSEFDFNTLKLSVIKTATLLGNLHKKEGKKILMEKQRKAYDIEFTQRRLDSILQDQKKSKFIGIPIQDFFNVIKEAYIEAKLEATIIHSDANTGNFIFNDGSISVIDVATMDQSLDRNLSGMKTGAADVGRFLQSLLSSHPGKVSHGDFIILRNEFYKAYNKAKRTGADKDFEKGSLFHQFALEILVLLLAEPNKEAVDISERRIVDIIEYAKTLGLNFKE